MSLFGQNLDYTDKDFDSLRLRLINLAKGAFPAWTDFNVANFGNILLECKAFIGDVLIGYQDNQARESRFPAAQLLRSMLAHSKGIDYKPKGQTAATVDMAFMLAAPPIADVTVEVGDAFRTLHVTDPIVFQATAQRVIVAGADPPVATVPVEHSSTEAETFSSTGLPNQEFDLGRPPFLDGSLVVSAGNGAYTVVDDFLDSTSTDRHMTVTVDEDGRARIRFGNGINGEIPTGSISVGYKVGGGALGNVEPGAIRRALKSYTDAFGNPQQVTVSNALKASGGAPRQSVESIRVEAPRSLRALTRTVAREDFEINGGRAAGVARLLMLTRNEDPKIDENAGRLLVVPEGGGLPSSALKDAVEYEVTVERPHTLTFVLAVVDPLYKTVDVEARVHLVAGTTPEVAGPAIRSNLTDFFAVSASDGTPNSSIGFGHELDGELPFSHIYNVVRDTAGVRKMDDSLNALLLNGESMDVPLEPDEFPVLGDITLVDADTGVPF